MVTPALPVLLQLTVFLIGGCLVTWLILAQINATTTAITVQASPPPAT
ncbi:hypothetical protein ACX80L_11280 [Arthrobacter sp. MDT1-48-3]|nr:hypothetical protein [Arthrobacter agilis]